MPCERLLWVLPLAALACFAACGGSDDDSPSSNTPTPAASPNSERSLPPFEGPRREAAIERRDYRLDPDWALPSPAALPTPAAASDPVLHPDEHDCPDDWQRLDRPAEGFLICHPPEWPVANAGYVTFPTEERWFGAGIFNFADEARAHELAHVSVYVIPQFARPFRYTIDCADPQRVSLAGQPAVVCASVPVTAPEARIVSYHVSQNNLDYFVNIATYYEFDTATNQYTARTSAEALATALEIVGTFQLSAVPSQAAGTATQSASATATPAS
jgi:hypothetical protein